MIVYISFQIDMLTKVVSFLYSLRHPDRDKEKPLKTFNTLHYKQLQRLHLYSKFGLLTVIDISSHLRLLLS